MFAVKLRAFNTFARGLINLAPSEARNYYSLADILWEESKKDFALELYRFAACLEDKQSIYAKTYFSTARHCRQIAVALDFLERRYQRLGQQSAEPLLTLFWALDRLNRTTEAFDLLDRAVAECQNLDNPKSELQNEWQSELLMGAVDAYTEYGRYQQAKEILDRTRNIVASGIWLRAAAELAMKEGDSNLSLQHWQAILESEPLAMDAHRSIVSLLVETQGLPAALEFLQSACDRFPHSYSLHQLWIGWLMDGRDCAATELALQRLIEIDSSDAWARRQLARVLGKQRKFEEAFAALDVANELEPNSPNESYWRGYLNALAGDISAAKTAYKRSIELSIDTEGAIAALLDLCYSLEDRRDALAFIFDELKRQVTMGDAVTAYQEKAAEILLPETLLAQMQEAYDERPDLWQTQSALIAQLLQFDRIDEALEIARNFVERFPLLPRAWVDLSTVYRYREDDDNESLALQKALNIEPTWDLAIGRLSRLYKRTQQFELGKEILDRAIAREPYRLSHHCYLAEIFWEAKEGDAALERLAIVVRTTRGGYNYVWAWDKLKEWANICEKPEFAAELVRESVKNYPDNSLSWYFCADILAEIDRAESLTALDRAIALDPYYAEAYNLKARLLVADGEYEAALITCNTNAWQDDRPILLRATAAWVEQEWGKDREAIASLQEIVAIAPDYEWAWFQLVKYYRQFENLDEYLPAAQKVVELDPKDHIYWGYLGDAYNKTGDRANAKIAWEKAIEISPSYEYGFNSLFELAWQEENYEAAAILLTKIKPHNLPATYLPPQIKLNVCNRDYLAAKSSLVELCNCQLEYIDGLQFAITAMKEVGLERDVEAILAEQLQKDTVSDFTRFMWLETAVELKLWSKLDRFFKSLDIDSEFGRSTCETYTRLLGKNKQKKILLAFVTKYEKVLRSNISSWGAVGLALRQCQQNRELVKWYWDWQQRSDAEPWMLGNCNEALRAIDREKEARHVNQFALKLNSKRGQNYHFAWIAFDLALFGKLEAAEEYLRNLRSSDYYEPEYPFLLEITRAAIISQAVMGSHTLKRKLVVQHLKAAKKAYPEYKQDIPFLYAYIVAIRRIFYSPLMFALFKQWLLDLRQSLQSKLDRIVRRFKK